MHFLPTLVVALGIPDSQSSFPDPGVHADGFKKEVREHRFI